MADYFGKDCNFLTGVWEDDDCPTHRDWEPVINHCIHPNNKKYEEGNCNKKDCPIKEAN